MKCDDCLDFLEEYIDGELLGDDFEQVSNHLVVCQILVIGAAVKSF